MRKIIPAVAMSVLFLSACQTAPNGSTLGSICRGATVSLNVASAVKQRLSAQTRADVTHGVTIIDPFCSQETPPNLDTLAQIALTVALTELLTEGQASPSNLRSQGDMPPAIDWPSIRDAWKAAVARWNST